MTEAISPFAPTGRNVFLRLHGDRTVPSRIRMTACAAFLGLVIRYWNTPRVRRCFKLRAVAEVINRMVKSCVGESTVSAVSNLLDYCLKIPKLISFGEKTKGLMLSRVGFSSLVKNTQMIQSVLMYWFAQFEPDKAQKNLWMVSSSSTQRKHQVDEEIFRRFAHLVRDLMKGRWREWCADTLGYRGKLAAIVALDQFSRHIHRHCESTAVVCPIPPQAAIDEAALQISLLFSSEHKQEVECGVIPLPMYIFALMPYRHANTIESVRIVQIAIEKMVSIEQQADSMLRRFRNTTNRRMAVLQDTARRDDGNGSVFSDDDILETGPFEADMASAATHVVFRTIRSFLEERGICPQRQKGEEKTFLPVIVSLSGGVDSMVVVSVLVYLATACAFDLKVFAVHIDYANRPESAAEASYIQNYCNKLGVTFVCRRIGEVTRGETARDDYERIARDIRYETYRQTTELCRKLCPNFEGEVGVMLGHHRGDLRENVLSNAHKGCGPLDLSGMGAVSINDGVTIYRPLLPLEKREVFDYAHKFGVPFFKDTTPHWSTRGKLRNKLLPLLQEIYGEGSMDNLCSLALESDQARDLLHGAVLIKFLERIERRKLGIAFETKPWTDQPFLFWKLGLREALHRVSLGMLSDKSITAFLERIQCNKITEGWVQCKRDYAVFLRADGKAFVFFPGSFPFRQADQFEPIKTAVAIPSEASDSDLQVGPWKITAVEVDKGQDAEALLARRAFASFEELMEGHIQYYLQVPKTRKPDSTRDEIRPLIFPPAFSKLSRPRAWKGINLKVQSVLPLLGNDDAGLRLLSNGSDWVLVMVSLKVCS